MAAMNEALLCFKVTFHAPHIQAKNFFDGMTHPAANYRPSSLGRGYDLGSRVVSERDGYHGEIWDEDGSAVEDVAWLSTEVPASAVLETKPLLM